MLFTLPIAPGQREYFLSGLPGVLFAESSPSPLSLYEAIVFAEKQGGILQSAREAAAFRIHAKPSASTREILSYVNQPQVTRTAAIFYRSGSQFFVAIDDIADPKSNLLLRFFREAPSEIKTASVKSPDFHRYDTLTGYPSSHQARDGQPLHGCIHADTLDEGHLPFDTFDDALLPSSLVFPPYDPPAKEPLSWQLPRDEPLVKAAIDRAMAERRVVNVTSLNSSTSGSTQADSITFLEVAVFQNMASPYVRCVGKALHTFHSFQSSPSSIDETVVDIYAISLLGAIHMIDVGDPYTTSGYARGVRLISER